MLWTNDRCKELEALRSLLCEVSTINRGSGCIERIQKCIELADRLQQFDLDSGRESFWYFLHAQAIADRQAAAIEQR